MLEYDINLEELIKNPNVERLSDKLDLFKINDVLNEHQCNELISIIKQKCTPSSVIDVVNGGSKFSDYRTSSTAYLSRKNDQIICEVEDIIFNIVKVPEKYSEQIQGQFYKIGQQYKPHFDTLFPTNESEKNGIEKRGNRTWTVMIYLNDVVLGGHTKFTKIDLETKPKRGTMILWRNTIEGKNITNSMHWGMPVEDGEKFILTKWYREKQFQDNL